MIPYSSKKSNSFKDLTSEQIENLAESIDALDKEEARIIKEELEEEERKKVTKKPFYRLRKSPLEIINRSLFFIFLGSFFFSFISVYAISNWWFLLYLISAFSCILYQPNRKAIKELLDAWPNLKDLIKSREN